MHMHMTELKDALEINHEPEYLPKRASSNCIHGTRLKVHQDSLNQNLTVVKDIIGCCIS